LSTRTEIAELIARYAWSYDDEDSDALAGCFTEDAEFDYGTELLRGRDAICARLNGNRAAAHERGEQPRHVMTNVVVDEAGDGTARVRSYLSFTVTSANGPALLLTATYDDLVVHDGGEWRFQRRAVHRDQGG
jgi:3-phenylpropionate/cinnamic acid dioxygenase small subunit